MQAFDEFLHLCTRKKVYLCSEINKTGLRPDRIQTASLTEYRLNIKLKYYAKSNYLLSNLANG